MNAFFEKVRGLWRVTSGRLFVWRDASQETVEEIAELEFNDNDEDELHEMVRQAKEELALRERKQSLINLNKAAENNGEPL